MGISGFFKWLREKCLPAGGNFFEQFGQFANVCQNSATTLYYMLDPKLGSFSSFTTLEDLEKRADDLVAKIRGDLTHTFITPIDREDIYFLTGKFDDIVDCIESVGFTLYVNERVFKNPPGSLETEFKMLFEDTKILARRLAETTENLGIAVERLKQTRRMQDIRDRVHRKEREADRIWRQILERKANFLEERKDRSLTGAEYLFLWWIEDVAHNIEHSVDRVKEIIDQMAGIIDKFA